MIEKLYKIETDKLLHFIAGLLMVQATYGVFHIICSWSKWIFIILGLAISILVSGLKEIYDKHFGGVCNPKDFYAGVIGALCGVIFNLIIIL